MKEVLLTSTPLNYNISVRELFSELQISINQGDKIGLVGANGAGKSTLINLINGTLSPDDGEIIKRRSLKVGYVEQFLPNHLLNKTALELVIEKLPEAEREFNIYKAELALEDIGVSRDRFNIQVSKLSGGQLNLIMLARAIITEPELLLLDEPTNHLDLKSLLSIENYLNNFYKNAFILISHDKDFLDSVTNKTFILQSKKIFSYDLPFSKAKDEFKRYSKDLQKKQELEKKEIERLKISAKRLANWGKVYDNEDLARKAKSMEKRIEKLEDEKTETIESSQYKLNIELSSSKSNIFFRVEEHDIIIPTTEIKLFNIPSFYINRGERVILLGQNGVGKSTFIREIVNFFNNRDKDQFYFNPQVELGYYDQEQEQLNKNDTIYQTLRSKLDCTDGIIKQELLRAGFNFDDFTKNINVLSGGEKARVLFMILKLEQCNFLILDEPTNHIDLYGREDLIDSLLASNATLLITTHDRHFAKTIGTKFISIENGSLKEIVDIEQYYEEELKKSSSIPSQSDHSPIEHSKASEQVKITDEDEILEQIVLLEEKLAHNIGQKKSHQKPKLQQEWKEEIEKLYLKLNSLPE